MSPPRGPAPPSAEAAVIRHWCALQRNAPSLHATLLESTLAQVEQLEDELAARTTASTAIAEEEAEIRALTAEAGALETRLRAEVARRARAAALRLEGARGGRAVASAWTAWLLREVGAPPAGGATPGWFRETGAMERLARLLFAALDGATAEPSPAPPAVPDPRPALREALTRRLSAARARHGRVAVDLPEPALLSDPVAGGEAARVLAAMESILERYAAAARLDALRMEEP